MNICMNCGKEYRSLEQLVEQRYCLSCEIEMRNSRDETKPPEPTEEEKSLSTLDLNALYSRIYDWHKQNHTAILQTGNRPVYIKLYLKLVNELPPPRIAKENDIIFVSEEVLSGLMEWANSKKDDYGIEMNTYAKLIANKIGGESQTRRQLSQQSRLFGVFRSSQ